MKNMLLIFLLLPNFVFANLKSVEIVTTDFPPYQIIENDKLSGMACEIVNEVVLRTSLKTHTSVYPWARAYQMALKSPVLIYSLARTKERENLFKWIGPVAPFQVYMWKLKSRKDILVKSEVDAKKYIVGGVFDDVKAAHLLNHGFVAGKNLEMVRNDDLNIKKLYISHIDLMPFDEIAFPYKIKNANFDPKNVEKLYKIKEISGDLYLAANLSIPDADVAALRSALNEFKKTDKYKSIRNKYTK